ncbi:LysR substrate-binding domain-containing protein [Paenarthrobacter sp. PAE-2]|uniref:LysR substrate-binding domain-containing protein n=1 Tax=Paenarthrobacter sp. PAE-2 TaxID=2982532 RepID=UPI00222ED587|nr:LysR substrate-binding domain-containing protein [Paenarthrobacter sp. PAE-2]MCW3768887.1 LysR substrate-binding domain-containing protein [Paenarthrobacter sp. PAE-2]
MARSPAADFSAGREHLLTAAGAATLAEPLVELSTTAAVRSTIAAGTAPGVLSALAVRDDLALHRLVAVPDRGLPLRRTLTAIWQTGPAPPPGPARDLAAIAAKAVPGTGTRRKA